VSNAASQKSNPTSIREPRKTSNAVRLTAEYFRVRDFEFVQPLYDLAFLLEIDAIARKIEIPKYRTFSLWRAGYSLDGYDTSIHRWLDGVVSSKDLDYVPSSRIKQYLSNIQLTGTIPELTAYQEDLFARCLRLRSIRGLGPSAIAQTLSDTFSEDEWLRGTGIDYEANRTRVSELCRGTNLGPWQSAHLVPPLLRFLKALEGQAGDALKWGVCGIDDPFDPVTEHVNVSVRIQRHSLGVLVNGALNIEPHFHRAKLQPESGILVEHQMGWSFTLHPDRKKDASKTIPQLAKALDPLSAPLQGDLLSDLHLHTAWSDGSASVSSMATAVVASGLRFFAVTDHSRSSKVQGGLTPILWLRQANALSLAKPVCPVLHGIEVDILKDGSLDLPDSLLAATDLVVASVHSSWTESIRTNTDRLISAIESGYIDVIAHPTSAVIGKPGVPDYVRSPAEVDWIEVFKKCAQWSVAVELNCFPSRLDLSLPMLRQAVLAGCVLSIGSDAHARSHLLNLRFGQEALRRIDAPTVLNRFSYEEIKEFVKSARKKRRTLSKSSRSPLQGQLPFDAASVAARALLTCCIEPPHEIPDGSTVIGIDLTAGDKATGVAYLDGCDVHTCSLTTDDEILAFIRKQKPRIVSIDSPLGLPGGGKEVDPAAGIVRVAERDLSSIGIPAYPALIDSMKQLTLRGIRLKEAIAQFAKPPQVIESYPGAAQDILCIPRKQKSLSLLREGLRRLGLRGPGLDTLSHDEMDAITSAIVGRYYEAGLFEPMGIPTEAQLIVPKVRPVRYDENPVICLSGKTGAGKSVVARYLSVFFGFEWIRTRNIIKTILLEDLSLPPERRLSTMSIDQRSISENDLREFGAVVLNVHKQVPIRRALANLIENTSHPIVVDSIRDTVDIARSVRDARPVITWYVDSDDSVIEQRLAVRTKLGQKRLSALSPVDHKASSIREIADNSLSNNGSLEELRWRIDDLLFSMLSFHS
jgi:histidinol phosphatase-like PHP family hydrolase/predicted nuclease with RNAse H fold/dephospho-CoA kinase